jgi:2-keto-4-pentenoate hydratase
MPHVPGLGGKSPAVIAAAAEMLASNRIAHREFGGFPRKLIPADEPEAYAIQQALHRMLTASGLGNVVGYKIGCTTPVMQAYMGIDHPCAGGVFSSTVNARSADLKSTDFVRVGVECEIAVQMSRDLVLGEGPFTIESVVPAIGGYAAAIEIVEDRYRDYRALDTPTLVADDFFGAGCVLGDWQAASGLIQLSKVAGSMWINRSPVGSGSGVDILGDPANALVWLANELATHDAILMRGDFVLLGSLVATRWLSPGDQVLVVNEPFGEVGLVLN